MAELKIRAIYNCLEGPKKAVQVYKSRGNNLIRKWALDIFGNSLYKGIDYAPFNYEYFGLILAHSARHDAY